jgi:hypothetical protein
MIHIESHFELSQALGPVEVIGGAVISTLVRCDPVTSCSQL